jgi:Ca2+-binding EF-hand superfamily protein
MHVWNYYAANQDRIEGANVDALLNDLLRARCTTPLSASELEEDKKLLLEEFASADGSFELSALSVLMSVEECFLFKFKKRSKISSVELMDIWMHYDENGDGSIEKFELEGLLRDLLTAANMPHQEKESGDGGGDGDGGGGNAGDGDGADVFDGSSMPPTVVTPTDVREYAEVLLDMFDTNHDGKISIGELSKILNTEKSYLEHLKGRSSLNKEQFNRVWKHYTKSSAGAPVIAGSSLRALAWDEIRAEQSKPLPSSLLRTALLLSASSSCACLSFPVSDYPYMSCSTAMPAES